MYNNTNTDVKVPVQKYHLNLEIMETCTFMTYVVQFGFLFYVCGVASYWTINLFTRPTVSKYKREKRRELKLNQNKTC